MGPPSILPGSLNIAGSAQKKRLPALFLLYSGLFCRLHSLGQSPGELVGAAGGLVAALDALELVYGLLCLHALHQAADALEIPVASAGEADGLDGIPLQLQVDAAGADALGDVCIRHGRIPPCLCCAAFAASASITDFPADCKPLWHNPINSQRGRPAGRVCSAHLLSKRLLQLAQGPFLNAGYIGP